MNASEILNLTVDTAISFTTARGADVTGDFSQAEVVQIDGQDRIRVEVVIHNSFAVYYLFPDTRVILEDSVIEIETRPYPLGDYIHRSTDNVVRGTFRHNTGPFRVFLDRKDGEAILSASAVVIDGRTSYGDLPVVAAGDVLRIDGQLYEIVDDRRGQDPRLVPLFRG